MSEKFLGRFLALVVLFGVPALESAAQDRYAEIAARQAGPQIYDEAIVLPGDAVPQTVISFRIPNSLLVFMQEGDGFVAHVEAAVELFRDGQKIDEVIWRGDDRASSFEETKSDTDDAEGSVRFAVVPGRYAYSIELSEGGTFRGGPPKPFEVTDFSSGGIGSPYFVSQIQEDSSETLLELTNLGGSVPYGADARLAVPLHFTGEDASLGYRVYRVEGIKGRAPRGRGSSGRGSARPEEEEIELRPEDRLVREGVQQVDAAMPIGDVREECFCWSVDDAPRGRLALIDLDTKSLENGSYVLDVQLRSSAETLKQRTRFQVHWRDMPASLYDVEVAIRNLSFIEGRDKIREMLRGSSKDQIEAFRAYWEKRDPSPGTVVNELMAEYYERIDYAASEFRTGRTPYPDGLRTDAARIYIVHGPPDDISSTFPSTGGVQQVWTYPDGRRFVFWAASSLEPLTLEEQSLSGASSETGGS